ncbi:hypothetical protein [Halovulum sp. GXIMD14793]
MRRVRKNLINRAPKAKTDVPMEEALKAREANLLGKNGILHGEDRYLAKAELDDLVLPINNLSPTTRAQLEEQIGPLDALQAGNGGELNVSALQQNGLGLAETSDIPALLTLGSQMHAETVYRDISFSSGVFEAHIEVYLSNRQNHQIFVHKKDGRLQGALFAKASPYFFSDEWIVSEDLFYIYPVDRSYRIARKFITAFEVWARTLGAVECCLSISTGHDINRIGRLYEASGYTAVGGVYKKATRG